MESTFFGVSGLVSLFLRIRFNAAIFLGELVGVLVVLDSLEDPAIPRSIDANIIAKF